MFRPFRIAVEVLRFGLSSALRRIGNVMGGAFVGITYWFIYQRKPSSR